MASARKSSSKKAAKKVTPKKAGKKAVPRKADKKAAKKGVGGTYYISKPKISSQTGEGDKVKDK